MSMTGILKKLDFLRNLFGADPSAARAKERLRIVLIQDQSSISSDLLNVLRHEMIGVVSRYLEIDLPNLEMGIQRREGAIALAASIPIVRIRKEGRALVAPNETTDAAGALESENRANGGNEDGRPLTGTTAARNGGESKSERRQRRGRRHLR